VAPLAVIAVVVVGLSWGAGFLHWLGVRPGTIGLDGRLKPWLIPYALIGAGAVVFVIAGRRLHPRLRSRWLGGLVVTDLVVFTLLGVVAVRPGLGSSLTPAASPGARAASPHQGAASPGAGAAHTIASVVSGRRAGAHTSALRTIAALGYPGRFAVYDPGELDAHELPLLGPPDLNVTSATPSVQGYSSIVDGVYAAATGSHRATGDGQNMLSPRAVGSGVFDQLDTSVLLTPPAYLITKAGGSGPAAGPRGTGQRIIAADHRATWYLATPLAVSRVEVPDADARRDAAAGARIGLVTPGGSTRWFPARAASASLLAISLPHPLTSVAVIGRADGARCHLGPPSLTGPHGSVFVADGQLQNALEPPRWGFAGNDGPFAVFVDRFHRGPLCLEPLPGRSTSGASVRQVAGSAAEPTAAEVFSPRGVRVVRAVADIPGWSATWHPRSGTASTLAVVRAGLVQAVDVPPGRGVVTWSYAPPGFPLGVALSLGAAVLVLLLLTGLRAPAVHRRR
jgi:hypothetical protein